MPSSIARLPQLAHSEWASSSVCPEVRLLAALINQAVSDARSCDPAVHEPAKQFLAGEGVNEVCAMLDWDVAWLRRVIRNGQWEMRYRRWTKEHMQVNGSVS